MKKFKQIDLAGQLILIASFVLVSIFSSPAYIFTGYFIVGLWQIISMVVHKVNDWNMQQVPRRYYHKISLVTVVLILLAFTIGGYFFVTLYIMLFAAPLMAVFYTSLCFREITCLEKRPSEMMI